MLVPVRIDRFAKEDVADLKVGSGILSFMSAQAGATQVIALEASSIADKLAIVGFQHCLLWSMC